MKNKKEYTLEDVRNGLRIIEYSTIYIWADDCFTDEKTNAKYNGYSKESVLSRIKNQSCRVLGYVDSNDFTIFN